MIWSCILGYGAGLVSVLLLIAIAAQDPQTDAQIGALEWVTIGYGPVGIVLGAISMRWSNAPKRVNFARAGAEWASGGVLGDRA